MSTEILERPPGVSDLASPDDAGAVEKPVRMLVVDDEEVIRDAMCDFFSARDYQIDCASCRQDAEARLQSQQYDILVSDLRLADSNGLQGLDVVACAQRTQPSIRCIVLTAYGSLEVESLARRAGTDVFLHKPKPLADLASVIDRLLIEQNPPSFA